MRSMKRKEKYGGLMRGRLHIKTTQIPPFFSCIPVFQSFLSLRISLSLANFLTLAKRISRIADHRCICICIFFLIFVCINGVIRLLILVPLKKISWKEFKFKTTKRRHASDYGERGNKTKACSLNGSAYKNGSSRKLIPSHTTHDAIMN